jgi:hypothetical protein
MRAALLCALAFAGCADVLGIHPIEGDDDGTNSDAVDAPIDGPDLDAPDLDGPDLDGPDIDAPDIDAPDIDAPAIDAPAIDAGPITIGEHALLAQNTTLNGNFLIARRFTVGGTTTIFAAGAYLKFESTNGHIKFAIYNDNANAPYSRRVVSGDITLDGVAGYNEIAIGPETLPVGTYWMVMATDMSADIGSMDTNNVTGAAASLPYSSAFPMMYSPQPASSPTTDRINLYLQAQP